MSDFIVGRNAVKEALRSDRQIQKLMVGQEVARAKGMYEIIRLAKDRKIEIKTISQERLNSYGSHHQGVVAQVAHVTFYSLDEIIMKKGEHPLLILLDGIEDPHNMGAIIRTAECVGATAVLFPKHHSAPINSTVAKTSAGAVEYMPLVQIGNVTQTLKTLKKVGFWIYGAHMDGSSTMYDVDLTGPTVIVIGNEGKGISRLVKEECDVLIHIPMFGQLNSLNASVAAGLIMYEVKRQRLGKLDERVSNS